jgi:ribonucleoside-diphosphate reductase beta chain
MSEKTGLILGKEKEGVNQILPHKHKWAWDLYKIGKRNNWDPEEIPMNVDINNWRGNKLTDAEKLVVRRTLGFFAGSESLVGNNLVSLFRHITDPECRQYMSRQIWEECLHNDTIVYICDSLNLDLKEVYEAYANVPSIKAKDEFLMSITKNLKHDIDTSTVEGVREVIKAAFIYWVICEGTFFFSGFAMLLALKSKLPGIGEQIEYTLRDESNHIKFGCSLIRQITNQTPDVWTKDFEDELVGYLKSAVELEIAYAKDVLPVGILGLNSGMFIDYMQYIGNRRLESVGISYRFANDKNPFDFLSEVQDLIKAKNFFESKVTDYQSAGALDDDF